MAAESPSRAGPTQITTSTTTIVTAGGAATWKIVRSIVVANTHTAPITVNVGVDTSNSDTAAKRIASELPLAIGETVDLLGPGGYLPLIGHASTPDLIYALASVATSATITVGVVDGP